MSSGTTIGYPAAPWYNLDPRLARVDWKGHIWDGDDFLYFGDDADEYSLTADAGGTQARVADEVGGVLSLATDGDNNDEVTLTRAENGGIAKMTLNGGQPLAFEARVYLASNEDMGFFVGLTEEGNGADFLTDDSGALADVDLVGFRCLTASPGEIDAVYRLSGGDVVEADGNIASNDGDRWQRFGFYFDGADHLTYVVYNSDATHRQFPAAETTVDLASATFPDGEEMGFTIAIKTGEDVAKTVKIDWWELAQKHVIRY